MVVLVNLLDYYIYIWCDVFVLIKIFVVMVDLQFVMIMLIFDFLCNDCGDFEDWFEIVKVLIVVKE